MPEIVAPQPRVHGSADSAGSAPLSGESKRQRKTISAVGFYDEYHGHPISDLEVLLPALRPRAVTWLVGDSSLDNKHWLFDAHRNGSDTAALPLCAGYEAVLKPPQAQVADVAYWLNAELDRRGLGGQLACVNTAVEESTLADRAGVRMLAQDQFVRDHIEAADTLVVSVGGNDVALRPSVATAVSMLMLTRSPVAMIRSGWAPGSTHFINLFRESTMDFVRKLIAQRKPRRVVVCTIYYLDPTPGGSWADFVLQKMGYDDHPEKLQAAITAIYERAHQTIADVDGVEVVAVPLFRALDGTDTADYVQRVEPSAQGGRKMAAVIADAVLAERPEGGWPGENYQPRLGDPRVYRGDGGGGAWGMRPWKKKLSATLAISSGRQCPI